jgi:hypothetical protein
VIIDGKAMDVPLSELTRKYQIGGAAENRLAEANRILDAARSERATLDSIARIRTLAQTDPRAAAEEARRSLGLQLPVAASGNQGLDGNEPDAAAAAIQAELATIKQRLAQAEQVSAQAATRDVVQQIRAAVQAYPLYQQDPSASERAEKFVLVAVNSVPGISIKDAAASVHADDVDLITRHTQQTRNQRAATSEQLTTMPPGSGSPAMSQLPSDLKMTPEEMKRGDVRGALGRVLASARKMAGG